MSYWQGPTHYCRDCRFRAVDDDGEMCGVCTKAQALLATGETSDVPCEACEVAAATTGWLCDACDAEFKAMDDDIPHDDGTILCGSCSTGQAVLWGLCDDCYDDLHHAAKTSIQTHEPYKWRAVEPHVPSFAVEATHHRRTTVTPFAEEATHHTRTTKRVTVNA